MIVLLSVDKKCELYDKLNNDCFLFRFCVFVFYNANNASKKCVNIAQNV